MEATRRRTAAIAAAFLVLAATAAATAADADATTGRSVNISSSWLLPQNNFPVFYRHFKDRVTWFEADAVCQFHHAQLVTVESPNQFETVRSYLEELDVTENVWIGLKRNTEASEFTWTNYQPLARSGYFREEVPRSTDPVCVVTDPTANFKWHSLHCGGPEVASFVCELPVPYWASKTNGCMTSTMEGMTVTFLPERPAIQLTKECSTGVSKNVTCKGNMKQSEIMEQLSCPDSDKLPKTIFKPVQPILADIKLRTTTSSSESEVEDYVEMATMAQYNDETFQSISKVMGRSGAPGLINLPQEMSIAQEPIKVTGRIGFDTNGIDSAFITAGAMAETTTTTTTTAATTTSTKASTTTTTDATIAVKAGTATTAASTAATTVATTAASTAKATSASATTAKATSASATTAKATSASATTAKVTATTARVTATTVRVATTAAATTARVATTAKAATTAAATTARVATIARAATTAKIAATTAAITPTAVVVDTGSTGNPTSTTAPTVGKGRVTTFATVRAAVKTPVTAADRPTNAAGTTLGGPIAGNTATKTSSGPGPIAATDQQTPPQQPAVTVVAKIPYTVATNDHARAAAATVTAPTAVTWDPIRVYKKIDLPPLYDVIDFSYKPTATAAPSLAVDNGTTTATATASATAVSGTAGSVTVTGAATATTTTTRRPTAAGPRDTGTATPIAATAAAAEQLDDREGNRQTPSTPTDPVTTDADNTAATAVTTTAANHGRKVINYDSYADHPNRSRHIVRPKQQHHHSYPYILYRLLG